MGIEFCPASRLSKLGLAQGARRKTRVWSGRICLAARGIMPSSSEHQIAQSGKRLGHTHHPFWELATCFLAASTVHYRSSSLGPFLDTYTVHVLLGPASRSYDYARGTARGRHGLAVQSGDPALLTMLQFGGILRPCATASFDCTSPYRAHGVVGPFSSLLLTKYPRYPFWF